MTLRSYRFTCYVRLQMLTVIINQQLKTGYFKYTVLKKKKKEKRKKNIISFLSDIFFFQQYEEKNEESLLPSSCAAQSLCSESQVCASQTYTVQLLYPPKSGCDDNVNELWRGFIRNFQFRK